MIKFNPKTLLTLIIISLGVIIFILLFFLRNKGSGFDPAKLPEKIVFNNKEYVLAKGIQVPSADITKIGVSNEGISIYSSKIPENIPDEQQGILVKRTDGYYQIYGIFPRAEIPPSSEIPLKKELSEIPITVGGEMTFNEVNNQGYDSKQVVSWSSQDFKITTSGKITGTFETINKGPLAQYPLFKDVLFVQISGDYISQFGDTLLKPLSSIIPLLSERTTNQTANFLLDSTFRIPPLVDDQSLNLNAIIVTITWVRIYKQGDNYYFQIFPADTGSYKESLSFEVAFDTEPKPINGRLIYYQVLPESALGGPGGAVADPDFDYYKWIKENLIY